METFDKVSHSELLLNIEWSSSESRKKKEKKSKTKSLRDSSDDPLMSGSDDDDDDEEAAEDSAEDSSNGEQGWNLAIFSNDVWKQLQTHLIVQGDTSHCSLGSIDIKSKVVL